MRRKNIILQSDNTVLYNISMPHVKSFVSKKYLFAYDIYLSKKRRPTKSVVSKNPDRFLLGKTCFNKGDKLIDSLLFVGTACDDIYIRTAHNAERENAEKALCVDSSFALFNPDGRFELVGFLDEESCRTRMKTNLILYCNCFCEHIYYLLRNTLYL